MDKIFVKINGETHHLWRAVDHEGEILESSGTKWRDRKAVLKFLRKSIKCPGQSKAIVTDKLRPYGAGLKDLGMPDDRETGRWLNNRAENSHLPFRRQERAMLRFRRMRSLLNSQPSIPQSTTTSISNAGSRAMAVSKPAAPPLLPSGVNFALPDTGRAWANRDWFAFV